VRTEESLKAGRDQGGAARDAPGVQDPVKNTTKKVKKGGPRKVIAGVCCLKRTRGGEHRTEEKGEGRGSFRRTVLVREQSTKMLKAFANAKGAFLYKTTGGSRASGSCCDGGDEGLGARNPGGQGKNLLRGDETLNRNLHP